MLQEPVAENNKLTTKEESYIERRKLFKNIWDAAIKYEGNEDVLSKPKVIKTLRMDVIDKCPVGKTKKQRIKNLRNVCRRILDFCDKQDADDRFYKKMMTPDKINKSSLLLAKAHRVYRKRLKRKAKSMFDPGPSHTTPTIVATMVTSERYKKPHRTAKSPSPGTSKNVSGAKKKRSVKKRKLVAVRERALTSIVDDEEVYHANPIVRKRKVLKRHGTTKKIKKSKVTGKTRLRSPIPEPIRYNSF